MIEHKLNLPFLSDAGKIFVLRGNEQILRNIAIQLTIQYGTQMYPVVCSYSDPFRVTSNSTSQCNNKKLTEHPIANSYNVAICEEGLSVSSIMALGLAGREEVDIYFIVMINNLDYFDNPDVILEQLRIEVNRLGHKVSIVVLIPSNNGMVKIISKASEYLFDVEGIGDEVHLTPLKYGGEPFPDKSPFILAVDKDEIWSPYQLKP